ncbi:MAG TPA: hypothetical protein VIC84_08305, partial [Blastocatellia bacterium]
YADKASGEAYVAIADQCNYRLAVYRLSDINRAIASVSGKNNLAATGADEASPAKGSKGGNKKGKKKR